MFAPPPLPAPAAPAGPGFNAQATRQAEVDAMTHRLVRQYRGLSQDQAYLAAQMGAGGEAFAQHMLANNYSGRGGR